MIERDNGLPLYLRKTRLSLTRIVWFFYSQISNLPKLSGEDLLKVLQNY